MKRCVKVAEDVAVLDTHVQSHVIIVYHFAFDGVIRCAVSTTSNVFTFLLLREINMVVGLSTEENNFTRTTAHICAFGTIGN